MTGLRRQPRARDPAAWRRRAWLALARLVRPLDAARAALHHADTADRRRGGRDAAGLVLAALRADRPVLLGLDRSRSGPAGLGQHRRVPRGPAGLGPTMRCALSCSRYAYLLGGFTDFQHVGRFSRLHPGPARLRARPRSTARCAGSARCSAGGATGSAATTTSCCPCVVCQALLLNRSPRLEDLSTEAVRADPRAHAGLPPAHGRTRCMRMQRAVAALGFCDPPVRSGVDRRTADRPARTRPGPAWVERWHATSTLTPEVRAQHPQRRSPRPDAGWPPSTRRSPSPGQWTRQTCAAWVAAVDRMRVGDYVQRTAGLRRPRRRAAAAAHQGAHALARPHVLPRLPGMGVDPPAVRPARALAIPRSIAALIGPDPRVIADEVWAKLMWAGLNLTDADLPGRPGRAPATRSSWSARSR